MRKSLNDRFIKLADRVSYGMGTPLNITVWILLVLFWFLKFAIAGKPGWFSSNAFNFPLNTVTTLAELYIGFLVAAAANRNERVTKEQSDDIENLESSIVTLLKKNTDLTQQIHTLTTEIHAKTIQK